jgi:hypothetical protein
VLREKAAEVELPALNVADMCAHSYHAFVFEHQPQYLDRIVIRIQNGNDGWALAGHVPSPCKGASQWAEIDRSLERPSDG